MSIQQEIECVQRKIARLQAELRDLQAVLEVENSEDDEMEVTQL